MFKYNSFPLSRTNTTPTISFLSDTHPVHQGFTRTEDYNIKNIGHFLKETHRLLIQTLLAWHIKVSAIYPTMANSLKRKLIIFILFFGLFTQSKAQNLHPDSLMVKMNEVTEFLLYRNHDTTYIESYAQHLTLKLLAINKFNYFKVVDNQNESSLRFRPDRKLNLGFGVSYKWFALDLAFNFGIAEDSDFNNKKSFDFQGTVFGGKHYISGGYQYYYGHQLAGIEGIPPGALPTDHIRDDIRTANVSLQYLFAYSYDKFSLKASFIQNEIQKKSAGSVLFGARFNLYTMDADSSIVPNSAKEYFNENLHLTNMYTSSIGINVGYMYTMVWKKHFYLTLGLIPGIGINLGDYKTDYKKPLNTNLSIGTATMNAIGYNSRKYFGGIQALGDWYTIRIENKLGFIQSQGKFKFHIGYRFG